MVAITGTERLTSRFGAQWANEATVTSILLTTTRVAHPFKDTPLPFQFSYRLLGRASVPEKWTAVERNVMAGTRSRRGIDE